MNRSPATPEEAALLVRQAGKQRQKVAVRGAGTWSPPDGDLVLSTVALDEITDLSPRDLTVTAGTGVKLSTLSSRLEEEGVWASWDPPGADRSLGSIIATGSDGPLAQGFGAIRDQLLGMTMVTGEGRVVTVGGRVMKNVAGFDLTRLACGSFGCLGIITSVNLRLRPRPREDVTLAREVNCKQGIEELMAIAAAGLTPAATELSGSTDGGVGWRLSVRLMGSTETVAAGIRELEAAVGKWEQGRWRSTHTEPASGSTTIKIGCPPRRLMDVARLIAAELPKGPVSAFATAVRWTGVADADAISAVRRLARDFGCPVTVERAPPTVLGTVGVLDTPDASAGLIIRRLLDSFDPLGVLAAGDSIVAP